MATDILYHFAAQSIPTRLITRGVYAGDKTNVAFAIREEADFCDLRVGKRWLLQAEQVFAQHGWRLIQVFGCEWRNRNATLTRLIANALGYASGPSYHARKLTVDFSPDAREATQFLDRWHPQGVGPLNSKSLCLRTPTGEIVAAMTFSMVADRRGAASDSWEGASLTRFATSARVPGAAGKLLSAWRKANPGVAVMSYSDPRLFSGETYNKLGFTAVKRINPDYLVWVPQTDELRHKSAFQRRRLEVWRNQLNRLDVPMYDHTTDSRTEFQMEDALGLLRVYQTGLIRWELAG